MKEKMHEKIHDVVIVGSGPAGYTAAIYAARANLKPIVIAGSIDAGGALINTTEVDNFPGFVDGIMGPDLMENMYEQAVKFGAEVIFSDAEIIDLSHDIKRIVTDEEDTYFAKSVILAMGSEYKSLHIPGEQDYMGRGVSYCATCDAPFFKDKEIIVVGGGDSAVEEATFLSKFAKKVTLMHRRDKLRASAAMVDKLNNIDNIEIVWNHIPIEIHGNDMGVHKILALNTNTNEKMLMDTDGIFIAIGHNPRSSLVDETIELDNEKYVITHNGTHTNINGVFACGDLVDKVYRQAITAAGSGCAAALDAQHYLEQL